MVTPIFWRQGKHEWLMRPKAHAPWHRCIPRSQKHIAIIHMLCSPLIIWLSTDLQWIISANGLLGYAFIVSIIIFNCWTKPMCKWICPSWSKHLQPHSQTRPFITRSSIQSVIDPWKLCDLYRVWFCFWSCVCIYMHSPAFTAARVDCT